MGMRVPELHSAWGEEVACGARAGEEAVRCAHEAAGHPGKHALLAMLRQGQIGGVGVTTRAIESFYLHPCDACAESSSCEPLYPHETATATCRTQYAWFTRMSRARIQSNP